MEILKLREAQEQLNEIVKRIEEHILSLPDNPRINRLNGKGNCFIIRLSDCGNNLSPDYHDFKGTYRRIVAHLSNINPMKYEEAIVWMVQHRKVKPGPNESYIHPDIIEYLKEILEN